jgi:hypothetical protein
MIAVRRYKTKRGCDAIEVTWYLGRTSLAKRIFVWVGIAVVWIAICYRVF